MLSRNFDGVFPLNLGFPVSIHKQHRNNELSGKRGPFNRSGGKRGHTCEQESCKYATHFIDTSQNQSSSVSWGALFPNSKQTITLQKEVIACVMQSPEHFLLFRKPNSCFFWRKNTCFCWNDGETKRGRSWDNKMHPCWELYFPSNFNLKLLNHPIFFKKWLLVGK